MQFDVEIGFYVTGENNIINLIVVASIQLFYFYGALLNMLQIWSLSMRYNPLNLGSAFATI